MALSIPLSLSDARSRARGRGMAGRRPLPSFVHADSVNECRVGEEVCVCVRMAGVCVCVNGARGRGMAGNLACTMVEHVLLTP